MNHHLHHGLTTQQLSSTSQPPTLFCDVYYQVNQPLRASPQHHQISNNGHQTTEFIATNHLNGVTDGFGQLTYQEPKQIVYEQCSQQPISEVYDYNNQLYLQQSQQNNTQIVSYQIQYPQQNSPATYETQNASYVPRSEQIQYLPATEQVDGVSGGYVALPNQQIHNRSNHQQFHYSHPRANLTIPASGHQQASIEQNRSYVQYQMQQALVSNETDNQVAFSGAGVALDQPQVYYQNVQSNTIQQTQTMPVDSSIDQIGGVAAAQTSAPQTASISLNSYSDDQLYGQSESNHLLAVSPQQTVTGEPTATTTARKNEQVMLAGPRSQVNSPNLKSSYEFTNDIQQQKSLSVTPYIDSQLTASRQTHQQEYLDMRSCGNLSQDWLDSICSQLIDHMNHFGICVIDHFLGSLKGELILKEVQQLYSSGQYTKGGLVSNKFSNNSNNNNSHGTNNSSTSSTATRTQRDGTGAIRSDRVIWINGCEDGCSEINNLIQTLCSVITNSSRLSLYSNNGLDKIVINKRTKAHVACYPGNGTRYIKHVDNPNGDGRVITAIYYLNKNWDTKRDGGLLRMFPAGMNEVANIEPLFDRVLFFWSDRRNPHEVLPAYRDRFAITVWYIGENRARE